ncbi:MAG: hypothetical protein FJZ96_08865 [Chloroflexi bacterium]|nr:hypothetical protein [Chloroflexota bacterium]
MKRWRLIICLAAAILLVAWAPQASPASQADNPNPPDRPVKLIFIHHSTGENWLTDGYGDLGLLLAENNYFVSDTNYGWGPDAIGDRTDIPNWTEWFASGQTPTYMDALFSESGQHAGYTRLFDDPGGENIIIMFKSCFPNSDLAGNPEDPAGTYEELSVAGAKYVYNRILQFFATRPDKLFVVITAPPLSDRSNAENARAFNNWLVEEWLEENNYPFNNVAVFDFYNILTDRDAHHWYQDGQVERILGDDDTLAYPSGDDHPSRAGSQKATEEFIPLLNIFYHRWLAGSAQLPPVSAPPTSGDDAQSTSGSDGGDSSVPLPPEVVQVVDDFEADPGGWMTNWDASTSTTITCGIEQGAGSQGTAALRIDYAIAPGSWGACAWMFDAAQDWSAGEWLAYDVHAGQAGLPFQVALYGGTSEMMETYIHYRETPVEYPDGFVPFTSFWGEFQRVQWEENAGSPFENPGHVLGLAFGFDGYPDAPYTGTLWIDNITLQLTPAYDPAGDGNESGDDAGGGAGLPCLGSIILPLFFAGVGLIFKRR